MIPIEKKLQQYLNKEVMYGMRVLTITGYSIESQRERVFIHTNERESHFDRPLSDVDCFLNELKLVQKKEVQVINNDVNVMSGADFLENILKDSIEKLQKDPNYIKQATAINNNVNSMINLTKLKIDFAKLNRKKQ